MDTPAAGIDREIESGASSFLQDETITAAITAHENTNVHAIEVRFITVFRHRPGS